MSCARTRPDAKTSAFGGVPTGMANDQLAAQVPREPIKLFDEQRLAVQVNPAVELMEELRDARIGLQQLVAEEAAFRAQQHHADVRKLAGLDKGPKPEQGVLAGELVHGRFQKSALRQRSRLSVMASQDTWAGTSSASHHQASGMLARRVGSDVSRLSRRCT